MDIMMRLKGAGFSVIANEFRQREKRLGSGLPLQDFVEIVLRGLPKPTSPEEKYANVSALVDLFEDMDINGDGAMEFDEFTSYCVDAGMVATRSDAPASLKHQYVRHPRHVIKTMNGALGVEKVHWSPLFQRFLVLENAAKSVKLFNADGYMVGDVRSQSTQLLNAPSSESAPSPRANGSVVHSLHEAGDPSSSDKLAPARDTGAGSSAGSIAAGSSMTSAAISSTNTGIFILDATFLHKFQCLAMSTTDFVISFYSMEEPKHHQRRAAAGGSNMVARASPSYDVLPKLTITTTTAQLLLRFCEEAGLLFSTGNDFVVNVWKITDLETKTLWKRLIHHQDIVMDIVEIPMHDLVASCDLNHTVQLWDIHDCRPRGALVGHTRGIKHMVFSKDHDLLLTAGFEFDAYGWDIASRQVVMKLVGHRAPLVGVQLSLFQTERAVTADSSGVIKVWDISRATGGGLQSSSVTSSSRQGGRGASHAVVLESLDPSHELSRFEPTTFISLHPLRRDLWTAASGSSTLHLFRSTRVQQFDEIPLKAFYHHNANRFVVVSGPMCSIWDGEVGTCVEEFANIGASIKGSSRSGGGVGPGRPHAAVTSSKHSSSASTSGTEASTDILLCVQDAKCKKLVLLSEEGEMGVFNCQNFVQMRRCEERFRSSVAELVVSGRGNSVPPPSCGIVGLHYCSENKLVIATDAHTSSIIVIDDSNNDSTGGTKETAVLRRLVHIPGGIAASAYSYHASIIATLDEETNCKIALWDFETVVSVGTCQLEVDDADVGTNLNVLSFWDEFPVLLASDLQGGVYFFAVMPTVHAKTGKLLHAFVNDHTIALEACPAILVEDKDDLEPCRDSRDGTFLTKGAESAAHTFLSKRTSLNKVAGNRKSVGCSASTRGLPAPVLGGVVTCMQVVFDDQDDEKRYLLFTADDRGVVRVWTLSEMMRRLSLFKIPDANCKYLKRGYHPRAMFAHDCTKQVDIKHPESGHDASSSVTGGGPGPSLVSDSRARVNPSQLKKLTKQRADAMKKSDVAPASQLAKLLSINRAQPGHAPPSASAVASAEAFLAPNSTSRRSTTSMCRKDSDSSLSNLLLGAGAMINARLKPSESRRRSQCWQHQDVQIVSAWTAHSDGITSMEVSRHPNILVTCSLDMKVFVWNWQGASLGKLFDAENIGPCRWRFRKDDSKRDAERKLQLDELMKELELPPQQKAYRRRQTLYENHIQKKSQKDLPHVSVLLLDHIVSQHPEVAAMEKDGMSSCSSIDEKVNAELEKARHRNYRAKASMLESLTHASVSSTSSCTAEEIARIHCLAQVGPLLCVDKFEVKQEQESLKFAEQEELQMDRQYLEDELAIGVGLVSGDLHQATRKKSSVTSIKNEIRNAQRHAEDMMENKIDLQLHATAMYTNLGGVERKNTRHVQEATLLTKQTCAGVGNSGGGESAMNQKSIEELLEPSAFLRSKLPERVLIIRPQTAPSPKPRPSLGRASNSSSVKLIDNVRSGGSTARTHSPKRLRPLTASSSETTLVIASSPLLAPARSSSLTSNSRANRRSSLDQMYLDELQRQHRSPITHQPAPVVLDKEQHCDDGEPTESTSLKKLDSINSIIDKAQCMCDIATKSIAEKPLTEPSPTRLRSVIAPLIPAELHRTSRARSTILPTLHEGADSSPATSDTDASNGAFTDVDESVLRQHLEATQRRMDEAMSENERSGECGGSSKRSTINRQRHEVQHQKKGKRMEDYLQQKRREMNTNIGAVFKRTSFAFPSAGAAGDTAAIGSPGDKPSKKGHKAPSSATASESADHREMQEAQAHVEKSKVFGIYGVKEVMSIIRLFWSMDDDCSGSLTLGELLAYKTYFERLGYHDMATVFQAIDKDGSGNVTLKELLEICFQYANKYQIEEMLKLAKLGDVATYFDASRNHNGSASDSPTKPEKSKKSDVGRGAKAKLDGQLSADERAELLAIFRVFDRNGDGGIGMDEILEALHVDDDETMARITAAEEAQLAQRDGASGSFQRRPSVAVASASSSRPTASAFTREEVRKFYEDVDSDCDNSLNFDEFVVLMKTLHGTRR